MVVINFLTLRRRRVKKNDDKLFRIRIPTYANLALKVSKSQKQIIASWILPKNERWGNFQYIKLPQRLFFGRIQDNISFFEIF